MAQGAPKGNQFWRARSTHGPKPKFKDPKKLWSACCEYFDWVEANPLKEEKGFAYQGVVTKETFSKMRAMTIDGLCDFIDIDPKTWGNWRKDRKDLLPVITQAERIIKRQKFEGASADLLNANIIARDLGMIDKQHIKSDIEIVDPESVREIAREAAFLLTLGKNAGK